MNAAARPATLANSVTRPVARSERFGLAYRLGLPIVLWVLFANGATHYRDRRIVPAIGLREVVEAEVASRLCPGLRPRRRELPALLPGPRHQPFRPLPEALGLAAQGRGRLERDLRADPEGGCRHMLDLYGRDGPAPHLLASR